MRSGSFWFWQWADSLIAAPALAESLAIKGGFLAIKGWLCNQPLRPEPLGGRTYTQSPRSSSFGGHHSPSSLPPPPLPLSKYRWEPRAARDLGFHDPSSTGLRFSPGGRWTDHLLLLLWLGLIFTSRKSGRSKKEILFGSRNGIQLAAFLSFSSLQLKMSQQ